MTLGIVVLGLLVMLNLPRWSLFGELMMFVTMATCCR
jgi:hypothetical protein